MELRVLKYFLAVAHEGSLTRAANYLHVTQPTLSRQLMDLEEELGCKLYVRGSHSVRLTEDGVHLKKRAEEILDMVERTEAEFSGANEVCGDIYIGGGETHAMKRLAAIAYEIHQEHPCVNFHIHSGNAEDVTERLDKGLIDFGVLIQPANLSKYDSLDLPDRDVWGVIMRRDSQLASKKVVRKEDLRNVPLLLSRQVVRPLSGNEFTGWFGEDYKSLNVVATFNLLYNAAVMVEQGLGYAVGLDRIVNTGTESNLCFRPLDPGLESALNVVWKKDRLFSPAAQLFLEKMREAFS